MKSKLFITWLLGLALVFLPAEARNIPPTGPTVIQANVASTTGTSGTTLTLSVNCTGANFLYVDTAGLFGTSGTVTGVTYNSVAMTQDWTANILSNLATGYGFYLVNPSSGTHNVVVTFSAAIVGGAVGAVPMTGVNTGSPVGTAGTATDGVGSTAVSVSCTTGAKQLVIGYVFSSAASSTIGANQRLLWGVEDGAGDNNSCTSRYGTGSTASTWTLNASSLWLAGAQTIKGW